MIDAVPVMETSDRYPSGWAHPPGYAWVRVFWLSDTIVMIAQAPWVWPEEPHVPYTGPSVTNGIERWAAQWYWAWAISHGAVPKPEHVIYVAHHPRDGHLAEVFLEAQFHETRRNADGTWHFASPQWTPRKRGYIEAMIGGRLTQ